MEKSVEGVAIEQEDVRADLRTMFRGAIRASLEIVLEEELRDLIGADWYARVSGRRDYRNGRYVRRLLTSLGQIEVAVPRSRGGGVGHDALGRYQRRTEEIDAMVTSAYVHGVSQRKMADVTEALLGERVSRSTVSRVAKRLEIGVEDLKRAPIEGAHPYVYLDATFIDARWARTVENVSALVAYAVGADGYRYLLAVTLGAEESEASWSELLEQLVDRGLSGVQLIISDEHAGLKAAVRRWFPEVPRQRCTVHLERNVLTKVPQRLRSRLAREIATLFNATGRAESKRRLAQVMGRWQKQLPEAMACLAAGFSDATTFYRFPKAHWRRIRTTNSLERLHREIKRRTKVVGAFPDRASALRLITAVALHATAIWGDRRYLDVSLLKKQEVDQAA
jgi:putative transposase